MNGSLALDPLQQRRTHVRALGATVRAVARQRRRGWWEARCWLVGRLGVSLRAWQDLGAGRVERVPAVVLERLERIRMEASA